MYEDDPLGRIGYLHDALFRAVRLVVDTGMHAKRWSREQAVAYYVQRPGRPGRQRHHRGRALLRRPRPGLRLHAGQAHLAARTRPGEGARWATGFDIRGFHDAGLTSGAVPLDILPKVIDRYIASPKA